MADETKVQWHPAFCSAVELTFLKYADSLEYKQEFNLSSKPLQVDLLVINKNGDTQIEDEVGRIFRQHNLLEYKSPGDGLNIDTYYKVTGYGCLYKVLAGKHVDEIKANEITLTFVRREKPEKLLGALVSAGVKISSDYPGIYYVRGNVLFDTQIISTKELPPDTHIWLKALTRNIDPEEARQVVKDTNIFPDGSRERRLADSVMQVAVSANNETFEMLKKEDPIMCDALRELMRPEMEEEINKAVNKAVNEAANEAANETEKALNRNKKEAAERMIRGGKLSDKDIAEYSDLSLQQVQELRSEIGAMV